MPAGPMGFGEESQVEGLQVRLDHNPQAVDSRDLRFSLRYHAQLRCLGITGEGLSWALFTEAATKTPRGNTGSCGFYTLYHLDDGTEPAEFTRPTYSPMVPGA